jgi:hypothetical protein
MTYTYQLKLADGTDVDTFKTLECNWQLGDEVRAAGNARYRITARIPLAGSPSSSTHRRRRFGRSSRSSPFTDRAGDSD